MIYTREMIDAAGLPDLPLDPPEEIGEDYDDDAAGDSWDAADDEDFWAAEWRERYPFGEQ